MQEYALNEKIFMLDIYLTCFGYKIYFPTHYKNLLKHLFLTINASLLNRFCHYPLSTAKLLIYNIKQKKKKTVSIVTTVFTVNIFFSATCLCITYSQTFFNRFNVFAFLFV